MFALLFDRRSGLKTGVLSLALALLLFGGGVLVGLNLRWSKEEVAAEVLDPVSLESLVRKAGDSAAPGKEPAPEAGAPDAKKDGAFAPSSADEGAAPPDNWVPMTEGAPPPGPST